MPYLLPGAVVVATVSISMCPEIEEGTSLLHLSEERKIRLTGKGKKKRINKYMKMIAHLGFVHFLYVSKQGDEKFMIQYRLRHKLLMYSLKCKNRRKPLSTLKCTWTNRS